jgi:hypothetical protein
MKSSPYRSLLRAVMLGSCFACSSALAPPTGGTGPYDALVATSDYTSSEIGLVAVDGGSSFASGINLGADPALTSSAGRYFWLARDLGRIIEIDTDPLGAKATYDANDPGRPGTTDPYDVAVAPDGSLWIARFDVPSILVLDADGTRRTTIPLSSQDPVDGNPNMSSIRILDPATGGAGTMTTAKAYVSLEILDDHDGLKSTRKSKLARIDLQTGAVEDVLVLAGRNPLTLMVQLGNQLYLADAGSWCEQGQCPAGQPDAGVERVDTASFASTLLVTGVTLGGHATEVAVTHDCGVVIVAGELPQTPTGLVSFDPASGATTVTSTLIPTTTTFTLQGLAWVGSTVFVGDRGASGKPPAIRLFDVDASGGCTLTERPRSLPLELPPAGFVTLDGAG